MVGAESESEDLKDFARSPVTSSSLYLSLVLLRFAHLEYQPRRYSSVEQGMKEKNEEELKKKEEKEKMMREAGKRWKRVGRSLRIFSGGGCMLEVARRGGEGHAHTGGRACVRHRRVEDVRRFFSVTGRRCAGHRRRRETRPRSRGVQLLATTTARSRLTHASRRTTQPALVLAWSARPTSRSIST